MALKNLLNINLLIIVFLFFFGCKTQKKKATHVELSDNVSKNTKNKLTLKKDSILYKESKIIDETKIDTNKTKKCDGTEDIKQIIAENNDAVNVYRGIEYSLDKLYIIAPEERERDSINLFVYNYEQLMRRLEKKGIGNHGTPITDPIKRDSLLWEEWQKMIKQKDYRHQYVPFNRNTMKFGTKK